MLFDIFLAAVASIAFSVVFYVWSAFTVVHQNEEVVVERFGTYLKTLSPGWHVFNSVVERMKPVEWSRRREMAGGRIETETLNSVRIPTGQQVYDFPSVQATTSDNSKVTVNGTITYRISNTRNAIYNIQNLYASMEHAISAAITHTVIKTPLEQILTQYDFIREDLMRELVKTAENWGITISDVHIQQITASAEVTKANADAIAIRRKVEIDQFAATTLFEANRRKTEAEMHLANMKADEEILRANRIADAELARRERASMQKFAEEQRDIELLAARQKAIENTSDAVRQYNVHQMYSSAIRDARSGHHTVVPYPALNFATEGTLFSALTRSQRPEQS